MLPSYNSGVKYIKLSRLDAEGVDRGYKIQNAQSLTLLAPSGESTTYDILNTSNRKDYYLIEVNQSTFNNNIIGSKSDYVEYEYDFNIQRDRLIYNPSSPSAPATPTPGQYNNIFDSSIQQGGGFYKDYPINIIKDENGPNQSPYWNLFSVYQVQETPSLPLEVKASIKINSVNAHEGELVLFKLPYNKYESGSIPQVYNKQNLISSYVTSFKEWENKFDKTSNFNRYYTTSSFKFTTGPGVGPRVYTLTGVVDLLKNETIGFGIMVKEPSSGLPWDSGSSLVLENASLKIDLYNKDINNPTFKSSNNSQENPTFQIIFNPDWGGNGEQPYNLDVYNTSDYNPTINNADGLISNDKFHIVERNGMYSGSIPVPENIDLITYRNYDPESIPFPPITYGALINYNNDYQVINLAEPSTVNNFNYEQIGTLNSRYDGSKNTSAGFNLNSKKGLGSPPAEQRTNIFLNCLGAGGQFPEVINATAFSFNTVIDDKLNIYPSTENDIPQFLDIQDAYAPGLRANVNITPLNSAFYAYDGLSGVHKILGLGKLQTLLTTGNSVVDGLYINQLEFEGAPVENFADFEYIGDQTNENGGVYRASAPNDNGGLPFKKPNDQFTAYMDEVGVSSVNFNSTDYQIIPFPEPLVTVNPNASADAGYVFENDTDYKFEFDDTIPGFDSSPEVQFEASVPLIWFGYPNYATSNGNNLIFNPLPEDDAQPYAFYYNTRATMKVRLKLIKADGVTEENIPIQNFPISTEYVDTISLSRGIAGTVGKKASGVDPEFNPYYPNRTPIKIISEPRQYKNGDKVRVEILCEGLSEIGGDYINSTPSARQLIKVLESRNFKLNFSALTDLNTRPGIFNDNGAFTGDYVNQINVGAAGEYYFKVNYQDPTPTDLVPLDEITNPNWAFLVNEIGDDEHVEENGLSIVGFSQALSNELDDVQILSSSQTSFGDGIGGTTGYSSQNIIPFSPEPGDQIRFGFKESYTRTIIQVIKPGDVIGESDEQGGVTTTLAEYLYFQLDQKLPPLPQSTVNHFIIRRYNKDNTQITMEVKKIPTPPNAPSGETTLSTITPEFPSEALSDGFSVTVRNLSNEGIL